MKNTEEAILTKYLEPLYRFALRRLQNSQDAEDLAQEILLHIIKGISAYSITNLDAWVWKVAYNRYNVFLRQKYSPSKLAEDLTLYQSDAPDILEEIVDMELKEQVFIALHSISSMYRDILVQYYVHEKSVKQIASLYSLPESTVKWRLHSGKEKLKERIENNMKNKVYEHINWYIACNGNMNSNKYLGSQIRRAICLAAYEEPCTIEEISVATGIPTMYIEDEISDLEYGDAIIKQGNKYSTDFIILRKNDNDRMIKGFQPLINTLADKITSILTSKKDEIKALNINGITNEINRLGYLIIPLLLRGAVAQARSNHELKVPMFPPRKDGGNGWFIVEEYDGIPPYSSGCNSYYFNNEVSEYISWFWIGKYFKQELNSFLNHLSNGKLRIITADGRFTANDIGEETTAKLVKFNLIEKHDDIYRPVFSFFKGDELTRFKKLFDTDKQDISIIVQKLVLAVYESYKLCVPERLHSQITGVFGGYLNSLVGFTVDELQKRGILAPVSEDDILTANIMYVNKNA